jgi:hypothetical protein
MSDAPGEPGADTVGGADTDAAGGADGAGERVASIGADGAAEPDAPEQRDPGEGQPTRQRVERTGRRRARLTPAPDTDSSPEKPARAEPAPGGTPDDVRITRERPPHW